MTPRLAEISEALGLPDVAVPAGVFWADHLATVKDQPAVRLALALQYLPLPAAFVEAATALRAMIRAQRKAGEPLGDLLAVLYDLAARSSLLLDTPFIEGIGPGYNVADSISREAWQSLPMPYRELGYENLSLLNRTDRKWVAQEWGDPRAHRSAQDYHSSFWSGAVAEWRRNEQDRRNHFLKDLGL